jgi:hypothetical protein
MNWLQAPDYWLTRLVFERALGAIYLVAYIVALKQFRPLLGEDGLLPAPQFLEVVDFWRAPSIFHWRYSDRLLVAVAWIGIGLSLAIVVGLVDLAPPWVSIPVWLVLWALYQSIVNIGQVFYSFGWESLLLEVGLLTAFFGAGRMAPPVLIVWLLRWVLFRLEFGAGLIKLRSDPCWRNLTCLDYHHETQPMPNPLSWYVHNLPRSFHRLAVLGNHFAQIVAPVLLFTPQPGATIGGAVIILTQSWLVLSGNFAWLNFITIALGLTAFDYRLLGHILPVQPQALTPLPDWWQALSVALAVVVMALSYWPVRNMLSSRQVMNASFNRFHFVNTYGAFGSITRERYEIVIEGTEQEAGQPGTEWTEYEFKGKPGDPMRRPPQVAPYHLRLDWLMWFAAMAGPANFPWIMTLAVRLLENDRRTLGLLRRNPFPERPPKYVRALLYRYRFTNRSERRETGAWWVRTLAGLYLPSMRLREPAAGGVEQQRP